MPDDGDQILTVYTVQPETVDAERLGALALTSARPGFDRCRGRSVAAERAPAMLDYGDGSDPRGRTEISQLQAVVRATLAAKGV
jgi:hypothetical protein